MSRQDELLELVKENDVLEPDTIRQLYPDLSEEEFNKVMAIKVVKHTRQFWENFYAFEDIVLALNDLTPDFSLLEGVTPEQIWYAIQLVDQIRPGMEYSKEVQLYIKWNCNEAGVYIYPPSVGLDNPYYEAAKTLSEQGPFPLGEATAVEVQAGKYLNILEYLKEKANG
jgi:hypothetical protein